MYLSDIDKSVEIRDINFRAVSSLLSIVGDGWVKYGAMLYVLCTYVQMKYASYCIPC